MKPKEYYVREIARLLGVEMPPMSTGSTEPRAIFDYVNTTLGLGIEVELTKPELARAIVESTGRSWNADCESSGGTVTRNGLAAVHRAVEFYVTT